MKQMRSVSVSLLCFLRFFFIISPASCFAHDICGIVYHQTDKYSSGSGDGFTFCNANNLCECQVAGGGNSRYQCCTDASSGNTGEGGCASNCKSMHFHPSIASPFLLPL